VKAAILAGGYGKRLRPLTNVVPKPLIKVGGKPILAWQIEFLREYGVDELVLCTSHLSDKIKKYVGNGEKFGVRVEHIVEREPLGTGGAFKNAEHKLDGNKFLVLNGDVLTDLDLNLMLSEARGDVSTIALVPLRSPFGVVSLDREDYVECFREKPVCPEYWINAGIYCFHREIFSYLPKKGSLELEVLPKLAEERKLKAVRYEGQFWQSIDSPKDIDDAAKILCQTQPQERQNQ